MSSIYQQKLICQLPVHSVAREVEKVKVVTLTLKDLSLTRLLRLIYHKDKILTWAMQELLKRLDGITRSDHFGSRKRRH
jgi:hypothetical protein